MKIVHLLHQYPPEFRGGTEVCVERLVAAQSARGDEPVVVAGSDIREPEGSVVSESLEGVPVHRIRRRPDENYSMDHRQPRVASVVVDLVEELSPDVVHLHHTHNLSGDLSSRLVEKGVPVLASLHDFFPLCARFFLVRPDGDSCAHAFPLPSDRCVECVLPEFEAGREALEQETTIRATVAAAEARAWFRAVVPSAFVQQRWEASGLVPSDRLVLLPHPVPIPEERPMPRDRSDGRLVGITWGNLAPEKGIMDLLLAMGEMADSRFALVVLGEAVSEAYGRELHEAAAGLDVTFVEPFSFEDLTRWRSQADLAIFPSRAEETFGLVVAEARSLGFPVLVSDRGALSERVGNAGATIPAENPAALAERLRELLEEGEPLDAWSEAAQEDMMTPQEHAERMAVFYGDAMAFTRSTASDDS